MQPYDLTLTQAVAAIRGGELSPVELVRALLERIDRLEPALQAWVTLDREGSLRLAAERERQAARGELVGPLHGIPLGIKDVFSTAGLRTTAGSPLYADFVPTRDAEAVARLRRAGAIILGKTVTTQFAAGDPGPTRNPWNLEHTPGGSSQGSGAGVAARMIPAALGTQTGGSTLRPAAYCGLVGLKPSYGRISRAGVIPLAWSIDTVGILTRTVRDAATLLQVLAGPDPTDPSASGQPVDDYLADLEQAPPAPRIGLLREFFLEHSDDETRQHTERLVDQLRGQGALVKEAQLPPSFALARAAQQVVHEVETATFHEQAFRQDPAAYAPRLRAAIEAGLTIPATYYLQAQRVRRRFRAELGRWLTGYDALLMPTTPAPAPRDLATTGSALLLAIWTFAGLPSLSLPTGLSQAGLPLGTQLVAGRFQERRLVQVARWCERLLDLDLRPPLG